MGDRSSDGEGNSGGGREHIVSGRARDAVRTPAVFIAPMIFGCRQPFDIGVILLTIIY